MAGFQSPQDDFGQADTATPGGAPEQRQPLDQGWPQPDAQTQDAATLNGDQQYGDPLGGQSQYQQVQPFTPQHAAPTANGQYATGLTSAQQVWYTLHCIYFGMGYLAKIPAKKALEDYGMAQLTSAEQTWYTIECIFFGAGYFAKLPTAKALSEMPQFQQGAISR
jgi:hypothetical protein